MIILLFTLIVDRNVVYGENFDLVSAFEVIDNASYIDVLTQEGFRRYQIAVTVGQNHGTHVNGDTV
jgi:hypothetical protein